LPVPQVCEHEDHSVHSDKTQSTGHLMTVHARVSVSVELQVDSPLNEKTNVLLVKTMLL
jgi:hypothetical protein